MPHIHRKSSVHHPRRRSIVQRIPRQVWVLLEVLSTILILHYAHISISDFLHLFNTLTPC
jgi:hypothetical protein